MKEVKSPKKPLIYYYCIVLLVLMVFNSFIVPLIARQQIKEVDYGTLSARWRSKATRSCLPIRTARPSTKPA